MEKISMTIAERAILLELLPKEADYITFKVLKDLKNQIAFSDKDFEKYEIKQQGNMLMWNKQKEEDKFIEIGEKSKEIVINALKKLNDDKKINDNNISLYEKFITE